MTKQRHLIDFSTVLASAVHDMKNSLCLLQQSIEDLGANLSNENFAAREHLASALYEAARLNTGLVQLLSLYRAEMENLPINVDECYVEDWLTSCWPTTRVMWHTSKWTLDVEQETQGGWFLDADLVTCC